MRKLIALMLVPILLLCGCGALQESPAPAPAAPAVSDVPAPSAPLPVESTPSPESSPEAKGLPLTFTDDLGRKVTVVSADRVAALIGSFADIWCIAGGHDVLVAAANDSWTSFDLNLGDRVVNTGAVKSPDVEQLLSAAPDLVLASCNTTADIEMLDTLTAAGITTVYFDVESFPDYLRMLDICTRITGNREAYEQYGLALQGEIDAAVSRQDGSAPTVLYVRASSAHCVIKGSSGNLLGEMLADFGCVNVADSDSSMLENLSMEAIMMADPDYIFVVLQGADPKDAQAMLESTLLSNPAWNTLRAVREGRFYILDNALYNLKPNARWGYAYENLANLLYPQ